MIEINLEDGLPSASDALGLTKSVISNHLNKGESAVFIHGYGSSGKGGKIRIEVRSWLKAQERNGKLQAVIFGEEFEMFNLKAMLVKDSDNELLKYYGTGNCGVTIVQK